MDKRLTEYVVDQILSAIRKDVANLHAGLGLTAPPAPGPLPEPAGAGAGGTKDEGRRMKGEVRRVKSEVNNCRQERTGGA